MGGSAAPTKIHIGFVRPVSADPIVTTLRDVGSVTASHAEGLDWEFTIIWYAVQPDTPHLQSRVFRLEIVP